MKKIYTKILVILIFHFFLSYSGICQTTDFEKHAKNNTYVDMSTLLLFSQISINYERILFDRKKIAWYGRLGLGKTNLLFDENRDRNNDDFILGLTMLTGKSNNHFELDLGTYIGDYNGYNIIPIIDVGYRYQKPKRGVNFKAKIGSLGLGIGLGYNF